MRRRLRALVVLTIGAAGFVLAGCGGDDGPGTVHLYDRVPVPAVPDRTARLAEPPAEPLADGEYWSPSASADATAGTITFTLGQALFGPTCDNELGADACPDGIGVVDGQTGELVVVAADLQSVTVVGSNRQNFAVTGDELVALMSGGSADGAAPEGFAYSPYPFLLSVRSGTAEAAHQIWTP